MNFMHPINKYKSDCIESYAPYQQTQKIFSLITFPARPLMLAPTLIKSQEQEQQQMQQQQQLQQQQQQMQQMHQQQFFPSNNLRPMFASTNPRNYNNNILDNQLLPSHLYNTPKQKDKRASAESLVGMVTNTSSFPSPIYFVFFYFPVILLFFFFRLFLFF